MISHIWRDKAALDVGHPAISNNGNNIFARRSVFIFLFLAGGRDLLDDHLKSKNRSLHNWPKGLTGDVIVLSCESMSLQDAS